MTTATPAVGPREALTQAAIDGVARRLGLEPPHEFIARTYVGHTTRSLVEALALLEGGREVCIVARSRTYARELETLLRSYAKRAAIDATRVTSMGNADHRAHERLSVNVVAVYDHCEALR